MLEGIVLICFACYFDPSYRQSRMILHQLIIMWFIDIIPVYYLYMGQWLWRGSFCLIDWLWFYDQWHHLVFGLFYNDFKAGIHTTNPLVKLWQTLQYPHLHIAAPPAFVSQLVLTPQGDGEHWAAAWVARETHTSTDTHTVMSVTTL